MRRAIAVLSLIVAFGCTTDDGATEADTSAGGTDGTDTTDSGGTDSTDGTDTGSTDGTDSTDVAEGTDSTDGTDDIDGSNGTDGVVPITWHGRVRAIVESNCAMCHFDEGIGPFQLDSYEDAKVMAPAMADAVEKGRMPPWLPDPECHPMRDERVMTPDEVADVVAWVDQGMPEGEPADYVAPPAEGSGLSGEPSLELDGGVDYTANPLLPDDYRCLPLDHTFEETTYITAFDVKPDESAIVHHVLLYLVEEGDVDDLVAADEKDPEPGYTCFGGPKVGGVNTVGGWVPGSPAFSLPPGSAIRIPAGSRIVMQVHYNTLPLAGEAPPPDRTKVQLWTMDPGETPDFLVSIIPLPHGEIDIPAGDPESVQLKEFTLPVGASIIGVTPHMHLLGSAINATLIRNDSAEECLVDIPEWDFNWQQFYLFPDDAFVSAVPGDKIRLTCTYDNSAANQPFVNGEQLEPVDVTWGEGTLDEMCLTYIVTRAPFAGDDDGGMCPGLEVCVTGCPDGDADCYVSCSLQSGTGCATCLVPKVGACAAGICPTELADLVTCLNECGDYATCLVTECKPQFEDMYACIEGPLEAGQCDTHISDCDVAFGD